MFEKHFGLAQDPFSIAPDPRYLFLSPRHRDALAHLLYGVGGPEHSVAGGFVLLTGDIGTGKTTLCRCLLEQIPPHCHVAYIFNPKLTVLELLQTICQEFGITLAAPPSTPKGYIDALNTYLLRCHGAGESCVLIIDEAQNLAPDVLEQLRLLTNLETHTRKLLQIVLIGQPELRAMLERPELEQLAQRVVARFHLDALDAAECTQYIAHRMSVAGHHGALPFDDGALKAIARLSHGVPRRINLLCGRALLGAYAHGLARVDRQVVQQAAHEVFGTPLAPASGTTTRTLWLGASLVLALGIGGAWWRYAPQPPGVAGTSVGAPGVASQATTLATDRAGASAGAATSIPVVATTAPVQHGQTLGDTDHEAALRRLRRLWPGAADGVDPCRTPNSTSNNTLQCHSVRAFTLPQLRQLNRPGVLTLREPDGSTAPQYVVVQALDGAQAVLALPDGTQRTLTLATLALRWSGEFTTFWQPPEGYVRRPPDGSQGPAIAVLAQRLAQAQGAPEPRTASSAATLSPALREQLKAYQRAQGLVADGNPGPLTYMQLESTDPSRTPRLEGR